MSKTKNTESNGLIAQLLKKYTLPETFKVETELGDLEFKNFKSRGEMLDILEKAEKFAEMVHSKNPLPAWLNIRTNYPADARMAYLISELSVAPKISQLEAYEIMKSPILASAILNAIENSQLQFQEVEVTQVEDEKKDLQETTTTE